MGLRVIVAFVVLATLVNCGSQEPPPPESTPPAATSTTSPTPPKTYPPVQVEMKNVHLHLEDGLVLKIRYLRGDMTSRVAGEPPFFDDLRSYALRIHSADLGIDMASLSHLMNRHVFGYEDAPLKDLTVEIDEGRLKQSGKLHKGVWLPFSMKASVAATPDGRLKLHMESVKALGVPATKLLDLLGLSLEDLMSIEKRGGVRIVDDDVIIAPGQVLPPPAIEGALSAAELRDGELRQTFASPGRPAALTPPDPSARNYIYFSGSSIRFGKLTMTGADLQLIDQDPGDPYDFHAPNYSRQLVAGYSKNTTQQGLKTYTPDYGDLKKKH